MVARLSIKEVVKATGLEECEVRFFEQVFREFLTFTQLDLDKHEFTQDHVDVLKRIKELVHHQNMSVEEVKRQLRAALRASEHAPPGNAAVQRGLTPYTRPGTSDRYARVISVASGKGGVGKTMLTVNLAIAFAQMGQVVGIFDADLGLANVHILMGIKPRMNLRHVVEDRYDLSDVVNVGPEGVKIVSGGQGVREMANLTAEQRRAILRQMDRLEREVDILLVDTGAGISENVLRFASFADEVIIVTTPSIAAAADGYSIIKILLEMEPNSKIGLVGNQAKNMYHSKNIYNRINTACRKYLNYSLGDLGYIVSDARVETACQMRKPLMLAYPECEAAKCVRAIANTVLNTEVFVNHQKESSFSDLMGQLKRSVVGA